MNMPNTQLYDKNSSLQFFLIPQCIFTKLLTIFNAGNLHVMVLKVLWIKILFIKLTNSSKHSYARVYVSKTISCFVATNMPNPLFQSKTHVLGGSMPFHSRTWHVAKTGIEAHLMHEFVPIEPFLVFLQQTCPFHFYQSKTHVLDGFPPFIFAPDPLRKLVSGCI